jgi:hypothetical protein
MSLFEEIFKRMLLRKILLVPKYGIPSTVFTVALNMTEDVCDLDT